MKILVTKFMKIYKMPAGVPKSTVLVIIFRVFIWLLSYKNAGKKLIIHMHNSEMVFQEKGQDHLIMKG